MNIETLKELKPPFGIHAKNIIIDSTGKRIAKIMGHVPEEYEYDTFAELSSFITTAMNEKWERDFGAKPDEPS